jgi:NADH dehydrogenase
MHSDGRSRVVVVGGGFGGLQAVKVLSRHDVDVTLIDRNNYHLFQPLSYQVATGALSPGEIAVPLRQIFRRHRRVEVLMADVTGFDLEARAVSISAPGGRPHDRTIPYDRLVVAGGSDYAYFGHDEWRSLALEVKSLDSALEVRGRIMQAFEVAELERDPEAQASWLTFVVVGAGPTGVEMAGQIAELARDTLPGEFRHTDPQAARVLLVELADRVLTSFPPSLSEKAARSLRSLGVTPLLSSRVVDVQPGYVDVEGEGGTSSRITTQTVVWAAGVNASPLARLLADAAGVGVDSAGRVLVEPDLSLPGHREVLALGDMVQVRDPTTARPQQLPGVAPVAMQQGRYAAHQIMTALSGGRPDKPFHYRDKGTLATIGRARAVADIRGLRLSGFLAWMIWLVVHIFYLIGFENRIVVLIRWAYSFFTHGRGARLITEAARLPEQATPAPERAAQTTADH